MLDSFDQLVPLTQALIPPAVAQAFGLPSLPGTFCFSERQTASHNTLFARTPEVPALASASAPAAPVAPAASAHTAPLPAPVQANSTPPATNPTAAASAPPRGPPWMGQFGAAAPMLHHPHQHVSFSSPLNAPTTSGSTGGPAPYGHGPAPYPMYHAAPPLYASALPGVFGNMQYTHPHSFSHGASAASVDFSAGPASSGQPAYHGMRLGPGMPSAMTESQEDDPGDGTARAVKRARLVWTPQLHKRFEEAVAKLGPEKSIPKNIMQEMNVEGLTRENVASHLQKWRLQRKIGTGRDGAEGGEGGAVGTTSQGNSDHAPAKTQEQHSHASGEGRGS